MSNDNLKKKNQFSIKDALLKGNHEKNNKVKCTTAKQFKIQNQTWYRKMKENN